MIVRYVVQFADLKLGGIKDRPIPVIDEASYRYFVITLQRKDSMAIYLLNT